VKPLKEVWMEVGVKKLNIHEEVSVKALLDSRVTGLFVDRKFVEKWRFKKEKLAKLIQIRNVNRTKIHLTIKVTTNISSLLYSQKE